MRAAMGTRARVVLYAEDEESARLAAKAALDRIDELEAVMTDYREDSELMRLCARAGEGPVEVSEDLLRVVVRSGEISAASDGAFDVTVGPLVRLWRAARRSSSLPEPSQLDAARALVGWRMVAVDVQSSTVELAREGMQLDLGGIGKGFACDEAAATLESLGHPRCLVEIGGDLVVLDPPPGQAGWRVGVSPRGAGVMRFEEVARAGVATSGDAEQFVEIEGNRYSHIVDPRTGLGLTHQTAVLVIAQDGTTADGLASALSVLGREEGMGLARKMGARAVFLTSEDR
jgi:thiamine biosynthesis lipoprotein